MEVKDNMKRPAFKINRLATSKAAPVNSDNEGYIRVLHNKKTKNGVILRQKQHGENNPKHHGSHQNFVIYKKALMPE